MVDVGLVVGMRRLGRKCLKSEVEERRLVRIIPAGNTDFSAGVPSVFHKLQKALYDPPLAEMSRFYIRDEEG